MFESFLLSSPGTEYLQYSQAVFKGTYQLRRCPIAWRVQQGASVVVHISSSVCTSNNFVICNNLNINLGSLFSVQKLMATKIKTGHDGHQITPCIY